MKLKTLTKLHVDAYNEFIKNIPVIIANIPSATFTIENKTVKVLITDLQIQKPTKSLWECRESLCTYSGRMTVKIRISVDGELLAFETKKIGTLPIMANSSLSEPDEIGGFFVVNGIEKVIRFLTILRRNHPIASNRRSFCRMGELFTQHSVQIRSVGPDEVGQINSLHYCKDGSIVLRFFYRRIQYHIPVIMALRLLKDATDEEIFAKTGRLHILQGDCPQSADECRRYVAHKFSSVMREGCFNHLLQLILPHLEAPADKFEFLCLAIRKLYALVEGGAEDDPDSMMNQEAYTELQIFSALLRERLMAMLETLRTAKTLESLRKTEFRNIGAKFDFFLATGNLNQIVSSDVIQEAGICINAERINMLRFVSHFRAVNRGAFFQDVKITSVRKLRPESFGFLCPVHTPDGVPCGLLNHLAHRASVTAKSIDIDVAQFGVLEDFQEKLEDFVPVLLNGRILGYTPNPVDLAVNLRNFRNQKNLNFEVALIPRDSVLFAGVFVFSHPGRFIRPVIRNHKLEFIGTMEQVFLDIRLKSQLKNNENLLLNMESRLHKNELPKKENQYSKNEYVEISDNNLSLNASLIPYAQHNQSPRNMYQCQMAKQAMCIPSIFYQRRTDAKMYVLNSGQTPIVYTHAQKAYALDTLPSGVNCIVAVLSYTAYDMEDAMVINRASIDRGFFSADLYQTVVLEGDVTGLVESGVTLRKGDVLAYCNKSAVVSEGGVVDKIRVCEGKTIVTMRIRRDPEIGDKFCSRHGQKGVCSARWAQTDMPYTEDGIVPDIIINPHAFPSRMTIGMMIESVMGKAACLQGRRIESEVETQEVDSQGSMDDSVGDRMADFNSQQVNKYLLSKGYDYHGNEVLYSGVTGNQLKADIFIGVVFYQRLRHMVSDKFQVRAIGPIQMQTRQPIGGKRRMGGIRVGEMERDALMAHGCAYLLHDRLQKCSDMTKFNYCSVCKSVLFSGRRRCLCGNGELNVVLLPYVFKYLCSELVAMNVRVCMEVDK